MGSLYSLDGELLDFELEYIDNNSYGYNRGVRGVSGVSGVRGVSGVSGVRGVLSFYDDDDNDVGGDGV